VQGLPALWNKPAISCPRSAARSRPAGEFGEGTVLAAYELQWKLAVFTQRGEKTMYTERDTYGMYKRLNKEGPGPQLMGADTLIGEDVYNTADEDLGDIKEIMLDMRQGTIAYAVLSFGGVMGLGNKLFAVPWEALTLDTENKRFILNVSKAKLKDAPGFDKDDWPDLADPSLMGTLNNYYGLTSRH
jgi:sporulation protein YlmC with PRC-barrel domain